VRTLLCAGGGGGSYYLSEVFVNFTGTWKSALIPWLPLSGSIVYMILAMNSF
jgi:hypothetical protein